jgi:four helix bundle protein
LRRRFSSFVTEIAMTNSFRRLFVWEASIDLSTQIIALCDSLVARRRFVIADQMTRAAISVPSNIAEGEGRLTNGDRRHYLVQARGSLYELETQLEIVMRAGLAPDISGLRKLTAQIGSGLTRMIQHRGG